MKNKIKQKHFFSIILTISGFVLAIFENVFVPQKAVDVSFETYLFRFFQLNANQLFRLLLIFLIIIYLISGVIAYFEEQRQKKYLYKAKFRFVLGLLLGIWDLCGTKLKLFPQPFFPGPAEILDPFLSEGGFIILNTAYSLRLYILGFTFGVILGIGTGILIGWSQKAYYWINPVLEISGVVPAVAWMPFALTLLPTPFWGAVFLIVICSWFPIASLTAAGIKSTPKTQYEAAKILGGSTTYLLLHVAIPNAMPQIFTGISNANAYTFTTLVMAEMLGQPGGLGYYINLSKVWSAYNKVFTAILIMAVLFSTILKVVNLLRSYVLRWQKGVLR